ncbi:bifunctional methyltransferase/pyrophosphohydrolase YabN [Tepidibacter thalassicus]|uniref:Tetrapyrrole methylase family protein / MazG family protein n=1 Tax=Tepidibacter thalassicus DSM 15285 TaxID=1123350 RepID=A0A1M5TMD8_9FIRM|nr:nucleoside triphosphate pyrophosphohydrolase [Tepidibacter thalassicus]SHH51839.1 tetrapyrrole methylase family protein / MazG family protein [Tepidibacter thalassicus DSM 15285]
MASITIVGLGPGDYDLISHGAYKALKCAENLYFRTKKHPIVDDLINEGIEFKALDYFYEQEDDFEKVYKNISEFIINEAKTKDITYAVPGHPRVAESTVQIIEKYADEEGIKLNVIPSMSFVDAMFDFLGIDPVYGFKLVDAFDLFDKKIDTSSSLIITQVYDKFIASEVKLNLMNYYNDDQYVYIVKGAGIKNIEEKYEVKLYELDRIDKFDYLTSIYIPSAPKKYYDVSDLENIMEKLRGENGCPWDKKQTHESLKPYIIEEAYELVDAIEKDDLEGIVEELGDILLQVVFHSQIGKEEGYFDLKEVSEKICKKLTYRHPHVFGEEKFTEEEFSKKWEELKKEEKGEKTVTESLKRIPNHLPSLIKANKVQKKAALVGFDWDNIDDVYKKIEEEYKEVIDAHGQGDIQYIEEELGDLLFSVVNLARFLGVDPEQALNKTTKKFIERFNFIEESALKMGKKLEQMTLKEMDDLWNKSKKNIN